MSEAGVRMPGWHRVYGAESAQDFSSRVAQARAQGYEARRRQRPRCNRCHQLMPPGDYALFCPRCIAG
jgi:hypothetical protein